MPLLDENKNTYQSFNESYQGVLLTIAVNKNFHETTFLLIYLVWSSSWNCMCQKHLSIGSEKGEHICTCIIVAQF